jgi:hypothetical protein
MTYEHREAFCLMKYRSDDGTEEETIWNSRDGVTPFVVTLPSGKTASHVNWNEDRCVPDFKPPVGSRMFVDITAERARASAERNAADWWDQPIAKDMYPTREAMVDALAASYYTPGSPDLIEVKAE